MLDRNWRNRAIPVVLHGDGARFTSNNANSLMVASWKPLLNELFYFGTFLLWALPKFVCASRAKHGIDSHEELWEETVYCPMLDLLASIQKRIGTQSLGRKTAMKKIMQASLFLVFFSSSSFGFSRAIYLFCVKSMASRPSTQNPFVGCALPIERRIRTRMYRRGAAGRRHFWTSYEVPIYVFQIILSGP